MSKETEGLFAAMFALEDVREVLRKTAPQHELDEAGKCRLQSVLS